MGILISSPIVWKGILTLALSKPLSKRVSKRKALTRRRGRLIVVLGGAASGKSELGLCLAEKGIPRSAPRAFLATAQARDKEMVRKIDLHQAS